MTNNTEDHDTEVGKLEKLLRSTGPNVTPSPGFKQKLLEQLLAKAKAYDDISDFRPGRSRKRAVFIRIATAAACLVFAVGFYFLAVGSVRDASADFAEMLARIRNVKTVSFEFKCAVPGEPEFQGHAYMKYPGQTRIVFPGEKIHIINADERKLLVLRPNMKKATFFRADTGANYAAEPLEKLRQAGDSAGEFLGREALEGRMVDVYEVTLREESMKVWVDPQEKLPVRIESRSTFEDGLARVMLIEQLQWNRAIPASLFAFNVPPDYAIEYIEKSSEESFLALMRVCTEITDGMFPAGMDVRTVLNLVKKGKSYQMQTVIIGDKTVVEVDAHTKETYKTCLRGLAFVLRCKDRGSWRYVGQGVMRGDKDTPVCWWRPPGSEMFRVMFGDLKIRNISAEQLPPQSGSSEFGNE